MKAAEMWNLYAKKAGLDGKVKYDQWCYGADDPDKLLNLTLEGKKTGTASAYPIYTYEGCEIPTPGVYSVILNKKGEAGCVIKTTRVTVVPFDEVTPDHAAKEGEGDLSLDYWRRVHKEVFSQELSEIGEKFDDKMPVVCEEFEIVYR